MKPLAPGMRICDATLGGGGHTARLLELCPDCRFTAIDADAEMIERARRRIGPDRQIEIRHGWFDEEISREDRFDRILMDLGVSMVHLREAERGFSFRDDGPLDMRLQAEPGVRTAAEFIRETRESDLADVIFQYGEERYSRRIARAICSDVAAATRSTAALAEVVRRSVPPAYRRGRNHPATRTFQAIRIAVNDELGRIERAIPIAVEALQPDGRLIVISFHSLEDRIVKHFFRSLANSSIDDMNRPMVKKESGFVVMTRKPIIPTEAEIADNPAARSAKLRVLQKRNV